MLLPLVILFNFSGENSDRNTKLEIYNEYDKHVMDSYNENEKRNKHDRKTSCKKPNAKIYWIDDKRFTTLLSSEVSGNPTKEIDSVKNEGDRRKLIRCMRTVSQNFWLNIEGWHNKSISEDNLQEIKKLPRIMVHS